jgi:hypothetical protein
VSSFTGRFNKRWYEKDHDVSSLDGYEFGLARSRNQTRGGLHVWLGFGEQGIFFTGVRFKF